MEIKGGCLCGAVRYTAEADPTGAQSAIAMVFARRILRMELTRVVLPTPGPPVITSTLETRATRTASRWLSASASFWSFPRS